MSELTQLEKQFNRKDIQRIVQLATGKEQEINDISMEEYPINLEQKKLSGMEIAYIVENGMDLKYRMVVRFGESILVLTDTGLIELQNWGGCKFPIKNSLAVYAMIVEKMKNTGEVQ